MHEVIAVTGAGGQLGRTVLSALRRRGILELGFDRHELNIADQKAVVQTLQPGVFDCVINCAAYTAVDDAEDHSSDAFAVNATAPKYLTDTGIPIIHISTDYVFDGRARQPYEVDSQTAPLSVYGRSKQRGGSRTFDLKGLWLHHSYFSLVFTDCRNEEFFSNNASTAFRKTVARRS